MATKTYKPRLADKYKNDVLPALVKRADRRSVDEVRPP